jgi:hypothetical protein
MKPYKCLFIENDLDKYGYSNYVFKADKDFKIGIGGNTQNPNPTKYINIKKGDLFVFDMKAPDGTRWIFYNFERGKLISGESGTYIGKLIAFNKAPDLIRNLIGVHSLSNKNKYDWQEEIKKLIKRNNNEIL